MTMVEKSKQDRARISQLLVRGNQKLGEAIWCFNIPAGATCPGKTSLCNSRCYAQRGMFVMPSVKRIHARNYEASLLEDFAARIIEEINQIKPAVIRLHSSGDIYSAEYCDKWYDVAAACPDTIFYAYTRSWHKTTDITPFQHKRLLTSLFKFAGLANVRLWFSVDAETGLPPIETPQYIRLAYMSVSNSDIPPYAATSLVFRDYNLRGDEQRYSNGIFVCPPENGYKCCEEITCTRCKVCWSRITAPHKKAPDAVYRIALPIIAT